MNIFQPTEDTMARAAAIMKTGGIISFPTETVYGLGADAFNPKAVARIFEAKRRPFFDPLIVHVASREQIGELAAGIPDSVDRLAERFWPGPLTMVLRKRESVPDIVTAGLDTVAVRMPRHAVAQQLIRLLDSPIAAPSANRFGSISPTTARHVHDQLGAAADMIIDGGPCEVGIESTIIKINGNSALLLRPGGVSLEDLGEVLESVMMADSKSAVEAPGQMPSHYSPSTPVDITESITRRDLDNHSAAFLFFRKPDFPFDPTRSFVLSGTGDLREAAANLFSALHGLDRLGSAVILAEEVPRHGLGLAIMDRLTRASRKRQEEC